MAQTVLVADDSIASQRLFEMVLTREGFDVITVGAGTEVVNRVKENHPDLALIDAVMPGVDGYQLCQTLKKDPQCKDVPIIMLAGTYEEVDRQRGASIVGANAILDKPAKSQAIISKVKEFLALQQRVQQAEEPVVRGPEAEAMEVVQEPGYVEEEYAFDEDSEEVDLAVESELLDEEAEWEESDEDVEAFPDEEETIEEVEEIEDTMVAEAFEEVPDHMETPPVPEVETPSAPAASQTITMSEAQLEAVAEEIARRIAAKLGPVLLQSLTSYVLQMPSVKQIVTDASKQLAQDVFPDIRDSLK